MEVEQAKNGKVALEKALENCFEIIFMDMQMPVMRGEEAVTKIQENLGKDKPKIVAITASVFSHQKSNFLKLGCHDFISKPFQIHHVYNSMKELLNIKYEYKKETGVVKEKESLPKTPDFSKLKVPLSFYKEIEEAAEHHSITRLESLLEKLKNNNDDGKVLAEYFESYVSRYDMEGILDTLKNFRN